MYIQKNTRTNMYTKNTMRTLERVAVEKHCEHDDKNVCTHEKKNVRTYMQYMFLAINYSTSWARRTKANTTPHYSGKERYGH